MSRAHDTMRQLTKYVVEAQEQEQFKHYFGRKTNETHSI